MGLGSSGEWWERPDQVQHTVPHDTTRRDTTRPAYTQQITAMSKQAVISVIQDVIGEYVQNMSKDSLKP